MRLSPSTTLPWIAWTAVLLASGCTSVKFTDASGKNVGFEYYPPKPYLLIQKDEKGVRRTTVVSLPNVAHPRHVKHVPGWGTVAFNFKTSNGMITEWGESFDSKGPETITAVTGTVTAAAEVAAAGAAIPMVVEGASGQFPVPLVSEAARLIESGVLPVLQKSSDPGLQQIACEIQELKSNLDDLKVIKISANGDIVKAMAEHRKKIQVLIGKLATELATLKKLKDSDRSSSEVRALAARAYPDLSTAIKKLKQYTDTKAAELYEIIEEHGEITFKPVKFPS